MSWQQHVPATASAVLAAIELRIEPPGLGSRSSASAMLPLLRRVAGLYATHDEAGLCELRAMQADRQSKVVVRPYSDPEDMAESYANDYGQDLASHFGAALREIDSALAAVQAEVATPMAPRVKPAEIDAARAGAAAARRDAAAAHALVRAQEEAARVTAAEKAELQRVWLQEVEAAIHGSGAAAVRAWLERSAACGWAGVAPAALAVLEALAAAARLEPPGPSSVDAAAFDEAASQCEAGVGAADFLWRGAMRRGEDAGGMLRALNLLADKLTADGATRRLGRAAGRNAQPLLLEAAYAGARPVLDLLLDSYERRAASEPAGAPETVGRLLAPITSREGLNALHMAAKVFGAARQEVVPICRRLAVHLDPAAPTKEARDFWSYAAACQSEQTLRELEREIEAVRSGSA